MEHKIKQKFKQEQRQWELNLDIIRTGIRANRAQLCNSWKTIQFEISFALN